MATQFTSSGQAWLTNKPVATPSGSSSGKPTVTNGFTPSGQAWLTQAPASKSVATQKPVTTQQPLQKPTAFQTLSNNLTSGIKKLGEFSFADKMPLFTPVGFLSHLAQGALNTPAEAAKGAVSLGEHIGAHKSTPQQVAGDVAAMAQFPLLFLGGGEVKTLAKTGESIIKTTLKALGTGAKLGGGFGALSGIQSGKNITNANDYVKNLLENFGIGTVTGGLLSTATHAAIPLIKGGAAKFGSIFVKKTGDKITIEHTQLAPEIAQSAVINHGIEKTPAGKEILKASVTAQQQKAHVGITPVEEGGVVLPDGKRVEINVVKPYDPATAKQTPYDTDAIIKARQEQEKIQPTHTITTPERIQLRNSVAENLYQQGGYHQQAARPTTEIKTGKRADIVTGLPASGKNTVLSDPLVREHGAILVDSDEAKLGIPESQGGTYAGAVHSESHDITMQVLSKALDKGNNIVMPMVGRNLERMQKTIQHLKDEGYDVHLHHNDVSVETSIKRTIARHEKTGKFVDPAYIYHEVGLQPNKNFDILKSDKNVTTYERYDNNGDKAKLIESNTAKTSESAGTVRGQITTDTAKQESTANATQNPRKVLTGNEVRAIRDVMDAKLNVLRESSSNIEDYAKGISNLVTDITDRAQGDKQVLSALRTEINKEMYQVAGAGGNYKEAFRTLETIKKTDPEMAAVISKFEDHIQGLDEKLLSPQEQKPQYAFQKGAPKEKATGNTALAPQNPVGTGKLRDSQAYKRLVEHLQEEDPAAAAALSETEVKYNKANFEKQAEAAMELVAKDPDKAYLIAKGIEKPPDGVLQRPINLALADRALAEKNFKLVADLESNGSLAQTRRGQEIAYDRGRFNDTSPHRYIQEVLDARLKRAGKDFITTAIDTAKSAIGKTANTAKQKAIVKIDQLAEKAVQFTQKERAKINFAQKLLDDLTCK